MTFAVKVALNPNTTNQPIVLLQDVNTMFLGTPSMYDNSQIFGVATIKRTKNRRASTLPNARKIYEEAQMTRRVKSYLSNLPSTKDEDRLADLSNSCEASSE